MTSTAPTFQLSGPSCGAPCAEPKAQRPHPRRAQASKTAGSPSRRASQSPTARQPVAPISLAASLQSLQRTVSPEPTPPLSRSASSTGSPLPEAASPLSRPSSPELLQSVPYAYGLRLEPLEESAEAQAAPATQGVPTYATRFVMPIVRGGAELGEMADEMGGPRSRLVAPDWKHLQPHVATASGSKGKAPATAAGVDMPLPKVSRLGSFMGVEMPYWHEVKRLAKLVPSEVVGIAGLVPTAYSNAQNTRYGFRRLLFFWQLKAACHRLMHSLLPPTAPSQAEEFRRAWVETQAARRGVVESSFFMSFNLVEHVSFVLTALPLTLKLFGIVRFVETLSKTLTSATPALMALHAGLHLGRHVQGLLHSRAAKRAADALVATVPAPAELHRLEQLQRATLHEQRVRMAWIAAWVAFEGGLAISSGYILSTATRPLWAGALLGASFAVTKGMEWMFGTAVEAPLGILWPQGTSTTPTFNPLRWRAFGTLADNARATTCVAQQQQVVEDMERAIWPLVPWRHRYLLKGVMALGSVPFATTLLDRLAARWLVPHVDTATPIVTQAHEKFWRLQGALVAAESQQRASWFRESDDEERRAPSVWPSSASTTPASPIHLRSPETEEPEPPASLKAQALGILLCRPRQALVDVRRALDWGGQTTLAACHHHTQA